MRYLKSKAFFSFIPVSCLLLFASINSSGVAAAKASAKNPHTAAANVAVVSTANVFTQHNNNGRTGANLAETILNVSNVTAATFGKLYDFTVDGEVYAQALYVSQLAYNDGSIHNTVITATMHNSVYAFDADTGKQLWTKNYGPAVPATDLRSTFPFELGILSTPVIDKATNTLFFVAATETNGTFHSHLHGKRPMKRFGGSGVKALG
jgi:outer membrane protein assembly factor BamB